MAYRILYGTDILWEPYSDNTDAITDASMSVNVNAAKYLDFTMPPTHSLYNVIAERDKLIRLYANDKLIYKGYITKITLDMEGYKQVNCSSVMSYLGDTHVRDYSTIEGEQPLKAPTSLDGLFQWYIDQHNKHCMDSNKRFIVGVNQAGLLDENNYVYRSSTQFPTTSSEIEEKILNLGGYIFERYEGDNNILDFYADAHEANTQILDFGVNITDFTHERSGEDQYTAIYATGYTPDPPEDDPEKKMRPISLADIQNGGSPYSPDLFKLGDVLYSISGVQRYGYREYYYSNDDITTTDYLLKAAGIVLTKLLAPTITLDVKAVDMALFMENGYEHLQLGQAVRVRSKPHNIDEYLMISGIDLDLQDPGQTTYTIGATYDTLTGQQSSYLKSLNSGINSSLDSVAALDKATKENAKGINEAKKDAANATSKANEASNKADVATNTANSANTKANEANTKAETATNTANSANTKANEANTKADAATETANSANTKANEANTKAETATNTANSANEKANEANTKADAATETANSANTKANEANTKADTATETANSANTKANEANTKADAATETANSANTKANEANTKADTATETANSANTKADEANTKADTATEIANSASQNAQKAQEGVAAAKDAASKAQAAADKAQADANANTKAVAQAQSAADAAKKAAADAQEKAENVESNLESANAVIEQHSNKLGELSTKVSNAVTNADAALTASTEAKQTATEASTTANTAYRDSQTAITNSTKATQTATEAKTTAESAVTTANDSLKQSSSAVQTANRIQNTLTTDYQTKADSDLLYATKSSLTETSESIKMEVSANYATKSTVEALQNVADNAIESWRGSGVPTSENKPASDWTTTEEKKRHSGDLYYDKDTGKAYRWGSDDGIVYSWVLNQDTDITKALQDASNAQKSADNAQTTANGAVTAAGNAQKSADGAKSTADSAKTAAANAQKTADTVQTDVDRLKIDIPNTYATKASLETTANSITAQVESVSTTANSAVTAASKAQQTADAIKIDLTKNYQTKENADNIYATKATLTATSESLSTSITKAQQTADGAVNAASNAQQTADAININLTKNYQTTKDADDKYATQTSLNATAESITSTVSKTYATKTALANTDTKAVNAATAASNAKTAADNAKTAADNAQSAAEAAQSTADTAKANAETAQSTADTAKTNAATAQSTADTAKANAAKAQSTADTAKTNAATAKSTADAAKKAAKDAQDDVDALTTRVSTAETSITQNADQIALRATKTEAQTYANNAVSGLQIGGRNMLRNTDTFRDWNVNNSFYGYQGILVDNKWNGKAAIATDMAWQGPNVGFNKIFPKYSIQTGDIITLSQWFMFNFAPVENFSISIYRSGDDNSNTGVISAECTIPSCTVTNSKRSILINKDDVEPNVWYRISFTFKAPSTLNERCRIEINYYTTSDYKFGTNGETMYIAGCKFERGNKATDWTPAEEDIDTRISSAETAIEQNANEINLRATKTEAQGYANTAKSDAINSAASDATSKANKALADAKSFTTSQGYLTVNSDKITAMVSATTAAKNTADDALELAGTKINESAAIEIAKNQIESIVISSDGGTTVTQTPDSFIWTISSPTVPTKVSQLTNDSSFTTMSAVESKGYQTASQVSTAANNAAKTATDFMKFSAEEGLTIGDYISGELSGASTNIKPDGLRIYDQSSNELAHFLADEAKVSNLFIDTNYASPEHQGYEGARIVAHNQDDYTSNRLLEIQSGFGLSQWATGIVLMNNIPSKEISKIEFKWCDGGNLQQKRAEIHDLFGYTTKTVEGVKWRIRKTPYMTEAWATITRTITGGMTDDGVWGYSVKADAVNYPTNLFSSAPKVMISARGPFGYPMLVGNGTAAKTPDMYFYRPTDYDSFTVYFDLYVIGE